MQIKPIITESDYKEALRAVSPMFDNEPELNSPEGDYFEAMYLLIEDYEKTLFQCIQNLHRIP
ncbi:hypothetical protein D5P15_23915 [Salmonella enterica subsp. enterica serovar Livingstone]|nr:hypothetical protein [Salmonella enterica subsp. enterica serovar Livingstone]